MLNPADSKKFRNLFIISFSCSTIKLQILGASTLFMVSYALFLGANEFQIGIIASIPFLANMLQLFAIYLYFTVKSRKIIVCTFTIIKSLFLCFTLLIPMLFPKHYQIYVLIIAFIFVYLANTVINNGFLEWNNFYVPSNIRGRYFSTRNLMNNVTFIATSLLVGQLLDKYDNQYQGYLLMLIPVLIFSIIQVVSLLHIDDYNEDLQVKNDTNFLKMISHPLKDKSYMRYIRFCILWNFANTLAQPYFNVYSVKYLDLNYSFIAFISSITCILKVFIAKPWGIVGDTKGWENIILLAGTGFALTTSLWFFVSPATIFLYPILQIIRGLFMIGINIAIFNLKISLSDNNDRFIYWSVQGMLIGLFAFIAPYISGFIISFLKPYNLSIFSFSINGYQMIFLLSGLLLLIDIAYFLLGTKSLKVGS